MNKIDDPRLKLESLMASDVTINDDSILWRERELPIQNRIPRFTDEESYSKGNFLRLRELHPKLQLDSFNKTSDRRRTILERTGWQPEFFRNKLVLECGCGAGPDTEVLLDLGAKVVAVDIAGVDIARENLNDPANAVFVQASVDDLPFRRRHFDIVFCHRVLQHTPTPKRTLEHILRFVKPDGAVFVHSYARTLYQMLSWKYALRPFTCRMDQEVLYNRIEAWTPHLFRFTCALRKTPPQEIVGKLLFYLAHHAVPIRNYRFIPQFSSLDDAALIEYAVHDTFDALSPRFDSPLSAREMSRIADEVLSSSFELKRSKGITLLRSKPDDRQLVNAAE
ncbi:Ubiquinone biosynthesis O-methyltransferase [Rosistilla carotiformis]|uniref:Ubiquinone biosynthesis O-methyltransferase n=1 Tax=Rosistilla carotiformis TaxID=2528017 RepID=A0A518K0V1_9BACT|nr:class I SAM-dependent methyltransferase [Rosistilla carotiformis]QDV71426.1 Ubiquinone biosynthesis O-methyltransferase [Rosistilla carotiformis]